jgi:branched-chain amino acid transport system permease protein
LFKRTRWGVLVRAATQDRDMVAALGINQKWLFTSVFALGVFLAALGGTLQIPRDAVSHAMDLHIIVDVFVVVVIGGLGGIIGALSPPCWCRTQRLRHSHFSRSPSSWCFW